MWILGTFPDRATRPLTGAVLNIKIVAGNKSPSNILQFALLKGLRIDGLPEMGLKTDLTECTRHDKLTNAEKENRIIYHDPPGE
jgi:hypothetical protein